METIKTAHWYQTSNGSPRGYIDAQSLKELWIHTGTACNLSCHFCLEGSSPGDQRLQIPRFSELKPWLNEALDLDVEQFSFTGGEPFLCKELIDILAYCSQHRPCLVLTNGTEALHRRIESLKAQLSGSRYPVSFRVSLDYSSPSRHDAGRGEGNFEQALVGLKMLHSAGFPVSVARHMERDENRASEEAAFGALFAQAGLPADLNLVAFPDFLVPGATASVPEISENCMTQYQNECSRAAFMCATSRMLVKQPEGFRVYACTLVDDDPDYDLGTTLTSSLKQRVYLKHHRCFSCFSYGSSCSER